MFSKSFVSKSFVSKSFVSKSLSVTPCFSRHRAVLRLAAAALPVLLYAGAALALDDPASRGATTSGRAEESMVPQAPVGHRQPRAADVPAESMKSAAEQENQRRERALDRKLLICRGC